MTRVPDLKTVNLTERTHWRVKRAALEARVPVRVWVEAAVVDALTRTEAVVTADVRRVTEIWEEK